MTPLPKVLVVEDDKNIRSTLKLVLSNDFEVDVSASGSSAMRKTEWQNYDLVILDLNLPDISGEKVCIDMRARGLRAPILILSGVSDIATKIALLDYGANDYLTKPFAVGELKARLRALSRQAKPSLDTRIALEAYGVSLDRRTGKVNRDGVPIELRPKEFDLLACLMEAPGAIISRNDLSYRVWDSLDLIWTNTVDVHINRLRGKLDKPFSSPLIHTVHGRGYKIDKKGGNI